MDWADDGWIMLSALQHYVYCPRQCALIHLEQTFEENIFTLRGNRVHERVDTPDDEQLPDRRVERALPIWSERLGLIGRADCVEFLSDGTPYPVEYKIGKRASKQADQVQLCAQALCLEEMFGLPVPKGALYYYQSRRRLEVEMTRTLRNLVEQTVSHVREMLQMQHLPPPVNDTRCRDCSLQEVCLPQVSASLNISAWLSEDGS
ncbi:CRISPR-associated protein Cas4 [Thermicanus aegyptius]|uniref:CRISPR-associated protein Cas4 n=1 Tax=Thermicanus aegyptius TaxID=94009 RepID=UPI00041D020C|nr:CRISPR-associated protein Cas4 [Thermicanus aegyptius]